MSVRMAAAVAQNQLPQSRNPSFTLNIQNLLVLLYVLLSKEVRKEREGKEKNDEILPYMKKSGRKKNNAKRNNKIGEKKSKKFLKKKKEPREGEREEKFNP